MKVRASLTAAIVATTLLPLAGLSLPAVARQGDTLAPLIAAPERADASTYLVVAQPQLTRSHQDVQAFAETLEDTGASVRSVMEDIGIVSVDLTPDEVQRVRQQPDVRMVLENRRYHLDVEEVADNAPARDVAAQDNPIWNLDRVDQRKLPFDQKYTAPNDGSGVNMYVIDSGIDRQHAEFSESSFKPGYGAVNDGQGTHDNFKHGTHVSSTIGGKTYGMAKKVTFIPVRIFDIGGQAVMERYFEALNWLVANTERPGVLNMSLGDTDPDMKLPIIDEIVGKITAKGITVVAAVGNDKKDACGFTPARVPEVIAVAASNNEDSHAAKFSNHGKCVDIYAPGQAIKGAKYQTKDQTLTLNGTSMAAPHVSAAALMYLHDYPNATPQEVHVAIVSMATNGVLTGLPTDTPNRLLYVGNDGATTPAPTPTNTPVPTWTGKPPITPTGTGYPDKRPTTSPTNGPGPTGSQPTSWPTSTRPPRPKPPQPTWPGRP